LAPILVSNVCTPVAFHHFPFMYYAGIVIQCCFQSKYFCHQLSFVFCGRYLATATVYSVTG
jgi:hypothetical protein